MILTKKERQFVMRADKKKFSTRLMAALMAGTLAAGMMGMNVSAAVVHSGNPITTIPVTKNVLTDGNTMAPNTTFPIPVSSIFSKSGTR